MSDWRGFIILGIGLAVPLLCLLIRREDLLLAWVCLTVGVNVFDARVGLNLPAARLVGLMVWPFVPLGAFRIQELLRTRPVQILLLSVGYLALLGIIFGFLYPWPNEGFLRPFTQTAPGRTIVYSIRLLADLGVSLFIARQIMRGTSPADVARLLLIGTTVAALGGVAEYVSHVQLYQMLTGYPIQEVANRVRGLNFEPRGLGLAMVHGLFLALLWSTYRRSRLVLALVALHLFVLLIAVSASALLAALFTWFCLIVLERRVRVPSLVIGAAMAGVVLVLVALESQLTIVQSWTYNLVSRFSFEEVASLGTEIRLETVALFLDIFDYTAFMALNAHPHALLLGAGPGLIMLPASAFIPDTPRWAWVVEAGEGITSLPTMGLLLEWANAGVIGVVLWFAFAATCWRALTRMSELDPARASAWRLGRAAFVAIAGSYLMQASGLAAIWPVFMGLGIGAAFLARPQRLPTGAASVAFRAPR